MAERGESDSAPPEKQLDYNFILYGRMDVIRHWLNNGADMTAESVAEYMAKMIKTVLG